MLSSDTHIACVVALMQEGPSGRRIPPHRSTESIQLMVSRQSTMRIGAP